ncbi:MAG: TolB family protein [Phycisphaerales bacterium]
MLLLTLASAMLGLTFHQPPAAPPEPPIDWKTVESPTLTNHVQLTFPDKFVKAGEAYFDHQQPPQWIIFQAIPVPAAGQSPDANYSMYVAKLQRDSSGAVTALDEPILVSPGGSANSCGWFDPNDKMRVVFGSTIKAPVAQDTPGYSKDRQRYTWQFPPEMEIVAKIFPRDARIEELDRQMQSVHLDDTATINKLRLQFEEVASVRPLFSRTGYDAEGSFSKDGRFYLYTHVDPTNNDPNLWVFDTRTSKQYPIVSTKGYDGGPFFSPDGKWICFRSDRRGDNNLQLFAGELAFGDDGDPAVPIGLAREIQLTDDKDIVNWCPFWHPSGKFLVYASSAVGHSNYEVFAIEFDSAKKAADLKRTRITQATGFDGLPVFSDDGKLMMWTSQRGAKHEREQRPSSQLWIANWTTPQ